MPVRAVAGPRRSRGRRARDDLDPVSEALLHWAARTQYRSAAVSQPPAHFPVHREAIAGTSVAELAARFGTPTFVYDAATIRARVAELKPGFDAVRFAQKANSNLAVLALMRREGIVVDAVSTGECLRALAAGFDPGTTPPGVVYTADVLDRDALDLVVDHGIHVNCGSPDMIPQLGARAPGAAITLRINPGFGHGHSQKVNTGGESSKHGIWHTQIEDCVALAHANGLRITGVHVHIGSGVDMEHLEKVAEAVCGFARRAGPDLEMLSAGGGLSVPYRDGDPRIDPSAYASVWNSARDSLATELGRPLHLELEPGRYLVAESGFLVTEIRAIKRMGSRQYYLVDAGFNNLARPVMYGAHHPISIVSDGSRPTQPVVVAGPLCESGDIFTQTEGGFVAERELPQATVGDLLVIECAGAYSFTMGSNYNSKPFAAEVLLDADAAHLVRARQPYEALFADESIPPHLR